MYLSVVKWSGVQWIVMESGEQSKVYGVYWSVVKKSSV